MVEDRGRVVGRSLRDGPKKLGLKEGSLEDPLGSPSPRVMGGEGVGMKKKKKMMRRILMTHEARGPQVLLDERRRSPSI